MLLLGVDMTSAPTRRKPIQAVWGEFSGDRLTITSAMRCESPEGFDELLATPGPWLGGFDFPFGLPRPCVEQLGWPLEWRPFARHIGAMSRADYVQAVRSFRGPNGRRELFRPCDSDCRACSPMKMHYVPVGRMLHLGSPALERAGVSVWPCAPRSDPRIALEVYPARVAQRLGGGSYKSESAAGYTPPKREIRNQLIHALFGPRLFESFGFHLEPTDLDLTEPNADLLDAVFALIQAAWASRQPNYGVPTEVDPLEGYIVGTPPPI